MASGMGVRGTMGRCYGFFADYKQCQVINEIIRSSFARWKSPLPI